jgi:hypothetical protein
MPVAQLALGAMTEGFAHVGLALAFGEPTLALLFALSATLYVAIELALARPGE